MEKPASRSSILSRLYLLPLAIALGCAPLIVLGAAQDCVEGVSWGFGIGAIALAVAIVMYFRRWWLIPVAIVISLFVIAILNPASGVARETPHEQWRCSLRLSSVALALWNYRNKQGHYPPAVVRGKRGKPMHSWRVLVLPYLSGDSRCEALYRRYNFNEPWDGPNNRKLLAECPLDYRCPDALPRRRPEETTTSYVAVVGSRAAWAGQDARIADERIGDKTQTTVTLIEAPAAAGIQWTEPRDLSLDDLQGTSTWPVAPIVHQRAEGKHFFYYDDVIDNPAASIVFAFGTTGRLYAEDLTTERLRSLLTVGGCPYQYPDDAYRTWRGESHLRIKWFNCSACAVWMIAVSIALYWTGWKKQEKGRADGSEEKEPELPADSGHESN
jgi:hypothetical protein